MKRKLITISIIAVLSLGIVACGKQEVEEEFKAGNAGVQKVDSETAIDNSDGGIASSNTDNSSNNESSNNDINNLTSSREIANATDIIYGSWYNTNISLTVYEDNDIDFEFRDNDNNQTISSSCIAKIDESKIEFDATLIRERQVPYEPDTLDDDSEVLNTDDSSILETDTIQDNTEAEANTSVEITTNDVPTTMTDYESEDFYVVLEYKLENGCLVIKYNNTDYNLDKADYGISDYSHRN